MTRTKILAAAAAVLPIILFAAGATYRDARQSAPQPDTESDFDERWISINKSDRLPLSPQIIPAATAQPEMAQLVASPPAPIAAATDDDIRQAEAERHRRRDICPKGRTYYMKGRYQYWRCVR